MVDAHPAKEYAPTERTRTVESPCPPDPVSAVCAVALEGFPIVKDALSFAKQNGPIALIAAFLVWAVVMRSEAAHDDILAATQNQTNINGQVLMALERIAYLSRVQCQREAGVDFEALRKCARDRE